MKLYFWKMWKNCYNYRRIGFPRNVSGQQHQQFRALGLGQRPFLDAPTSFTSHLRELETYRRNKHHHNHHHHHHHHHPNHHNNQSGGVGGHHHVQQQQQQQQQQNTNGNGNSGGNGCNDPNNAANPAGGASPSSGTHLGASNAHQDCYKHSPQHGGEFFQFALFYR